MYDLKELKAVANKACDSAIEERGDIGGAINWDDLGCTEVEHYASDLGTTGHRVYIEEAAPHETHLILFIGEKLEAAGYKNVEVVTAW